MLLFDREMDGSQVEENAAEVLNWIKREKFDYLAETINNSRGNSVYVSKKAGTAGHPE